MGYCVVIETNLVTVTVFDFKFADCMVSVRLDPFVITQNTGFKQMRPNKQGRGG